MKYTKVFAVLVISFILSSCGSKVEYYNLEDYELPDEIVFDEPMYYFLINGKSPDEYIAEIRKIGRLLVSESSLDASEIQLIKQGKYLDYDVETIQENMVFKPVSVFKTKHGIIKRAFASEFISIGLVDRKGRTSFGELERLALDSNINTK